MFWFLNPSNPLSRLSTEDLLANDMGDTTHQIFHYLSSAMFFMHWVLAIWVLAAICAKRWHDLNFPGWLAVVNTLPVLFVGVVFLSFFGAVDRDLIHRITVTPDPQNGTFAVLAGICKDYKANFLEPHMLTTMFFVTIVIGAFCYIGVMRGDDRANPYGKANA